MLEGGPVTDRADTLRPVAAPRNPRRLTELGALRLLKPEDWAKRVRRAVREADGYLEPAAESLEVSVRTLQRWLEDDLLADAAEMVAARRGYRRDR